MSTGRVRRVTGRQEQHTERGEVPRATSWPSRADDLERAQAEKRGRQGNELAWSREPATVEQIRELGQLLSQREAWSGFRCLTRFSASVAIQMALEHHPNRRRWEAENFVKWARDRQAVHAAAAKDDQA